MKSKERITYLEACLRDAGYWETDFGWHNGKRFVGLHHQQDVDPARCKRCGHPYEDHHYDGRYGGGCCREIDRYECCSCKKFVYPEPRVEVA